MPVAYTPQLVPSDAVLRPRVDAIDVTSARTFAAGVFDTVVNPASQGGTTHTGLRNMMAFNTSTGAVDPDFRPIFDAQVKAVEADPSTGSVFVGGDFSTVNGDPHAGLVKLDAATGKVDTSFDPYFSSGQVNDLEFAEINGQRRLIVAGGMSKKLAAVDPATGRNTGDLDAVFTDPIPGARGGVAVFHATVAPNGKRLIATGNFTTVSAAGSSHARRAFVMLDLPVTAVDDVRVDPWYYPGFGKECQATVAGDARRIANLQGLDWSPDGLHFSVAATGKISLAGDVWHDWDSDVNNAGSTVCDAVGRFSVVDDTQAEWINYTGGDSVWTVQDTGASVYIQGHFVYVDNPDGFASKNIGDKHTAEPASYRRGVAAIDPDTGKAESWAPPAPSRTGGKALVATPDGIWWGSDSPKFGGKARYGLAFTPLV